jgi:hypothetical protein
MRQLTVESDALPVKIQEGEGWSFFSELRPPSEGACRNDRRQGRERDNKDGSREQAVERTRHILALLSHLGAS